MLFRFTTSGNVRIFAINSGMTTLSIGMLGSGEITVLPVKLDLFPDKLPLNLPFLPFNRWAKALMSLFLANSLSLLKGMLGVSELR